MSSIQYVRLYADSAGESHMQKDLKIELTSMDFVPPTPPIEVSPIESASTYGFLACRAHTMVIGIPAPNVSGFSSLRARWSLRSPTAKSTGQSQGAQCFSRIRQVEGIAVVL